MSFVNFKRVSQVSKHFFTTVTCALVLCVTTVNAQTLTSNETGTHNGFYYSFWKDSGNASFTLESGGRYQSQWNNGTNNWVGGKGWNPGGRKVVNYEGYYGGSNSQNTYLALYGWTRSPLVEYYVIESYGSYDPSSCDGGQDYGTFQSDGANYKMRRCQRVNAPSIEGNATFYQYFSVRQPKKGFGNISGTVTVGNHFDAWASAGLNLGSHDYMILATEGYQSSGSSDITVSEGSPGGNAGGGNTGGNTGGGASGSDIVIRARGVDGGEHINLLIGGSVVGDWNLTTSNADYTYTGSAAGSLQVEFDNDGGSRDVILDYVYVNGETRQAEDMEYNTATYDGECGGGSFSETMHCGGVIGFGETDDCFSGACSSGGDSGGSTGGDNGGNSGNNNGGDTGGGTTGGNSSGSDTITVRAQGTVGNEHINLKVDGNTVSDWTLSTSNQDYVYTGNATGDIEIEFDNDASGLDVILDYIVVNGETRQAEDMEYNTSTYDGECGGGSYSETMHCSGVIGFGSTDDCFSGSCTNTSGNTGGNTGGSTGGNSGGGGACSGYVGITFDDGPGSNTGTLINLLNQNNLTPVTWFNTGQNITNNSGQFSQQQAVGEVQNHSYSHSHMLNWSYQQVRDELSQTNLLIQNAGGAQPTLFRPPYGETNSTINQAAQDLGLRVIIWDVDSRDWDGASASAIANATGQLQDGQVILMHDASYNNTNNAIAQIASGLQSRGLCPGRIDPNTGRAVAPSGGNTGGNSGNNGSNTNNNNNGNGGTCNWYGTILPLCQSTPSGWGWENSQSCVSPSTCSSQ